MAAKKRKADKGLEVIFQYAEAHGWELNRRTRKGSWVFVKPGRHQVTVCSTPSDHRARRNALSYLQQQDRLFADKQLQPTS